MYEHRSIDNHYMSVCPGNIKDARPIATINLRQLISDIKTPDQKTVDLIAQIRSATDEKSKSKLKWKLKTYTPCTLCGETRSYDGILEFTGLLALDFDKLPDRNYAEEFREYLFSEYLFIYATWLSSSGKGVRALVHCPISSNVEEFKKRFAALEQIMGVYTGFDMAPQNAVLPLFQSYDPDLLYREKAEYFTWLYTEPKPCKPQPIPVNGSTKEHNAVIRLTRSAIDKITDNGHPQLRGASFALGGYVGAGYISEYDAIALIDTLIDTNGYLSQKPKVYKVTARTMIASGQSKPLYLHLSNNNNHVKANVRQV